MRAGRRGSLLALILVAGCGSPPTPVATPSPTPTGETASAGPSAPTPPPGAQVTPPASPTPTPVPAPGLTGSLTCDGTDVEFAADVLAQPPTAEAGAGPAALALRELMGTQQAVELGLPPSGYRIAGERPDAVTYVAPGAERWAFVTIAIAAGGGWEFYEGGACDLRVALPNGIGFAAWRLDPSNVPGPMATSVTVLATETACASGKPPGARLQAPLVLESAEAITIVITVRTSPGGQDCPGNPEVPVLVQLQGPLGSRHLFDGSSFPAVQRD